MYNLANKALWNTIALLADLSLYSYEAEIIQKLLHEKKKYLAVAFNSTFRYIDDDLFINNSQFHSYVDLIYPKLTGNQRHYIMFYICFAFRCIIEIVL
jgi:hypothetical protein